MEYSDNVILCDKCGTTVPGWVVGSQIIGGWCTNCAKWVYLPSPKSKLADVRPVLQKFALVMNERLDPEAGYRTRIKLPESELISDLLVELSRLVGYLDEDESSLRILETAADVANMALVLSDPERLRNR